MIVIGLYKLTPEFLSIACKDHVRERMGKHLMKCKAFGKDKVLTCCYYLGPYVSTRNEQPQDYQEMIDRL